MCSVAESQGDGARVVSRERHSGDVNSPFCCVATLVSLSDFGYHFMDVMCTCFCCVRFGF